MSAPSSSRIAFLLPGQGSQRAGMGRALRDEAPALFERYMALADAAAGRPIGALTLEGSDEELRATEIAQPAVFALSLALAEYARRVGVLPSAVCGHSLGEYTAAVVAGALDVAAGMRLVAERGRLMAAVEAATPGAMAAVIGLDRASVETICARHSNVVVANVNGAQQIVISGTVDGVDRAAREALSAGAFDIVNLPTGAAFHSPLMATVKAPLAEVMENLWWRDPDVPVVTNVNGSVVRDATQLRRALVAQTDSPVEWTACVETLRGLGCDEFLEIGPGRVLSGIVRAMDTSVRGYAASSPASITAFAERSDQF